MVLKMFFYFFMKNSSFTADFIVKYDLDMFSWVPSLQGFLCPREDEAMQSILSPCSYFVSICLICLKQQTVRMKKSKFLRGSFWVCTDVLPTKHQSDIIDVLFHPSSTLNRTIYSSNTVINSPLSINPEDSLACI